MTSSHKFVEDDLLALAPLAAEVLPSRDAQIFEDHVREGIPEYGLSWAANALGAEATSAAARRLARELFRCGERLRADAGTDDELKVIDQALGRLRRLLPPMDDHPD